MVLQDNIPSLEYGIQCAIGKIRGVTPWYVHGINPAVADAEEDLWYGGGSYNFVAAAGVVSFVSDDATDADAGAGLNSIYVEGLNAAGTAINEIVTLAGLTPAPTTQEFYRVNRIYGRAVGATGWNAGTITASIGATTVGVMPPTLGYAPSAVLTVPSGYNAVVMKMYGSAGQGKAATYRLRVRSPGNSWILGHTREVYQGGFMDWGTGSSILPAMADIKLSAVDGGAGVQVVGSLGVYLIDARIMELDVLADRLSPSNLTG